MDVVIIPVWCIGIVADAPGWVVGCYRQSPVVFRLWLHWSPLPCPSVCGGAVRGRVKRRDGPDGRWRAEGERGGRANTLLQPSWVACPLWESSRGVGSACSPQDMRCIAQGTSYSEGALFENFISSKAKRFRLSESWT